MAFPDRLIIASRNPGKIVEIRRICADWPAELLTHEDVAWAEVEETEPTYAGNAELKALGVARETGIPALADDSGIEVDALGGAPGPRSARYAGEDATDEENLAALLGALKGVPAGGRTARYRAVALVGWPDGTTVAAEATCEGSIIRKPRGTGGFGYDPVFLPEGWDRTMAELAAEEKDRISHRGRSLRALRERLAE